VFKLRYLERAESGALYNIYWFVTAKVVLKKHTGGRLGVFLLEKNI